MSGLVSQTQDETSLNRRLALSTLKYRGFIAHETCLQCSQHRVLLNLVQICKIQKKDTKKSTSHLEAHPREEKGQIVLLKFQQLSPNLLELIELHTRGSSASQTYFVSEFML